MMKLLRDLIIEVIASRKALHHIEVRQVKASVEIAKLTHALNSAMAERKELEGIAALIRAEKEALAKGAADPRAAADARKLK